MANAIQSETLDQQLVDWSESVIASFGDAKNMTLGLTGGSRQPNDQRVIYRIAKALSAAMTQKLTQCAMLLCKLDVQSSTLDMLTRRGASEDEAVIERSALGNWDQVEITVKVGNVASQSLQRIPRLLPKWKLRYHAILFDLGPIHLVTSRTIGRLCDSNYVVLGPDSCASAQWISQYVDYHGDCGSNIAGTIVAAAAA